MSKILIDRSVVEQALDAFDVCKTEPTGYTPHRRLRNAAITALRAALEQQVEQEPVAWSDEIIDCLQAQYDTDMIKELESGDALIRLDDAIAAVEEAEQRYTHPQPPRQPLTEDGIKQAFLAAGLFEAGDELVGYEVDIARAVELAHGIGGGT